MWSLLSQPFSTNRSTSQRVTQNEVNKLMTRPEDERDGEPAHRPGADAEEDERGDDRGQVGVEDDQEGAFVAGADRQAQRLAALAFLADALVDQHVRVHRHAERQHQSGDARQREHRLHAGHSAEHEQQVHQHGEVGDDAADEVVDRHEDDHDHHSPTRLARIPARMLSSPSCAPTVLFHSSSMSAGELPGAQRGDEVVHLPAA